MVSCPHISLLLLAYTNLAVAGRKGDRKGVFQKSFGKKTVGAALKEGAEPLLAKVTDEKNLKRESPGGGHRRQQQQKEEKRICWKNSNKRRREDREVRRRRIAFSSIQAHGYCIPKMGHYNTVKGNESEGNQGKRCLKIT